MFSEKAVQLQPKKAISVPWFSHILKSLIKQKQLMLPKKHIVEILLGQYANS